MTDTNTEAHLATRNITKAEYLGVTGMLHVAANLRQRLDDLERAIADTLNEPDDGYNYFGHVSDAVSEGVTNADDLLRRMNIEVDDA